MRQTSEAFANKMLEEENNGNSLSFTEQIAKLEASMNDRIEKMQSELLEGIASKNVSHETSSTEVEELTSDTEVEELTDDGSSDDDNTEE